MVPALAGAAISVAIPKSFTLALAAAQGVGAT
jgi:hypothetical protein